MGFYKKQIVILLKNNQFNTMVIIKELYLEEKYFRNDIIDVVDYYIINIIHNLNKFLKKRYFIVFYFLFILIGLK